MKWRIGFHLIVLACICLTGLSATGSLPKVPPELIGTWNYVSMTALKNGKPFGTVHFQPDQWTATFNPDGTWMMKTPSLINPHGLNGRYVVHGHDLDMRLANDKPYSNYRFKIEQDGKVLVLTSKDHIITANKE